MEYKKITNKKIQIGIAVGLFLLTLLVVLFIYPNKKQFRYSYEIGKAWQYETLYAPFPFPVKKSATQITLEKENILNQATPYYDFDKTIGATQIAKAQKENIFSKRELQLLKNIYTEPISADDLQTQKENIFIIKNHISTENKLSDVKTVRQAKQYITRHSNNTNLLAYIQPNLRYNQEQTEIMSNSDNISTYLGKIQKNELIISRGKVVSQKTYQILESLRSEYSKNIGTANTNNGILFLGQFLFIALCLLFLYLFLRNYRNDILKKPLYLCFILLGIIVSVVFTRILLTFGRLDILLIPYTLYAIIIRTFMDSRTAMFSFLSAILICSFFVPNNYEFITLQIVTGIIAVLYLKNLDRRSQLLLTALIVFVSYSVLYLGIFLTSEGKIETLNPMIFVRFLLNAVFLTVAYPLLYLLEKVFGFLSDVTLIELSNTNNKLLRQLSHEAPGTFQHSLQVANLAEEGVRTVGGNPLLVRAGALYHDIGKMENPIYFTENQYGDSSPHKGLTYEESAKIIIGHITNGIKIAKKHNLPQYLVDFIATHHGAGRTEYFYRSEMNENPDKEVDVANFTYPGPDPFTIEQAILMMADSCEAATKSLKNKTEENITEMVTNI
ncbi:MAG: HDIG domain-containing protein, partial [Flavobacteriaceae bacterium]|nr:HDIG domain-containing protein [Flavobacteriaceae bacterium]